MKNLDLVFDELRCSSFDFKVNRRLLWPGEEREVVDFFADDTSVCADTVLAAVVPDCE